MTKWGPIGREVYERTYKRGDETWHDTVNRVVAGNMKLADEGLYSHSEIATAIENFDMLPGGRHLWVSGIPGRQFLFNCHRAGWTEHYADHFAFMFDELMKGGGVGSNYSNDYLAKGTPLKGIKGQLLIKCRSDHPNCSEVDPDSDAHSLAGFTVPDTREGWTKALRLLVTMHQYGCGGHYTFDVSDVRPRGAEIKGFGGTACGPGPLAEMLHNVDCVLRGAQGRKLITSDAMLIDHYIASCVIAGNVRRSARMSMKHWRDPDIFAFINCKQFTQSHWTTNISVEVDDEFWKQETVHAKNVLDAIADGMLRNGEPGVFNSSLASVGEIGDTRCSNPCLTGDTVIATVGGPRTFADLAESEEDVEVYSWHPATSTPVIRMMRRPHRTAQNMPILEVGFDSGLKVRCTPDHKFYSFRGERVEAQNLRIGQSVRAWSMSKHRDGHLRVHGWDSERNVANHQWVHRMMWENTFGPVPTGHVIHHKDEDGSNNNLSNLMLMTEYEHQSHHYPTRAANGFNGQCRNHKVVSIRDAGRADVFNGMVEDSHAYIILDPEPVAGIASGIVSANCGEVALEEWENCNLGNLNLANLTDPLKLHKAARMMTRFLIRATFSDSITDPCQQAVVDRNRRIGVGLMGFQEWLILRHGLSISDLGTSYSDAVADDLQRLRSVIRSEAARYCRKLRIPEPIKVTTVAPTGTLSQLVGCTAGIHPVYAKYFVRRVRYSKDDPKLSMFVWEDDIYSDNTAVVEFVCRDQIFDLIPEADHYLIESADELDLDQMLTLLAFVQENYADNAVSFTANIDAEMYTSGSLAATLRDFGPRLKGCTVMPDGSRPQAPFERLSKVQFRARLTEVKAASAPSSDGCVAGACPIR